MLGGEDEIALTGLTVGRWPTMTAWIVKPEIGASVNMLTDTYTTGETPPLVGG